MLVVTTLAIIVVGAATGNGHASEGMVGGFPSERAMISAPQDVSVRVWRDEQPGDEPRLHFAAVFPVAQHLLSDIGLVAIRLETAKGSWEPEALALKQLKERGLEVRAEGAATITAGTTVTPIVTLDLGAGATELRLPESIVKVSS